MITEFNSLYNYKFGFLDCITFLIFMCFLQLICRTGTGCLCKNRHNSRLKRNHSIHHRKGNARVLALELIQCYLFTCASQTFYWMSLGNIIEQLSNVGLQPVQEGNFGNGASQMACALVTNSISMSQTIFQRWDFYTHDQNCLKHDCDSHLKFR